MLSIYYLTISNVLNLGQIKMCDTIYYYAVDVNEDRNLEEDDIYEDSDIEDVPKDFEVRFRHAS